MNIVMLTENDPAGMGIAFTRAINRFSDHSCRFVASQERHGIDFDRDIYIPDIPDDEGFQALDALLKDADIFHFHILSDESMKLGPLCVKDYIKGKILVHHHHGHPEFRTNPDRYREKYRKLGRQMMVSTPDLLRMAPEATWVPNIVPLDAPHFMPCYIPESGNVRICQAPTRKDLKNTEEFIAVTDRMMKRGKPIERVIIEHTAYKTCLSIKQSCHIHFDHMQGYYGVSSLESLSQGKPVVAGLDDWNIRSIETFAGTGALPWVLARNEDELEKAIGHLVDSQDERQAIGRRSRMFMEAHWNEPRVLEILFDVYRKG